ncbi:tetratricopeptide repeat protein [Mucilaginibacter flavus]|uniref:tetratricopeptide repeat protein n=1 Tax=Mucilaginibacter flavus TaxID=931504 RepID=UPI0025B6129D|nr:tetratricopeptide repeat protein [Mucilaginibacter flavus]MDN3579247.1 tetratricopeptide repeat protein [Mucilaginibacter flavus]
MKRTITFLLLFFTGFSVLAKDLDSAIGNDTTEVIRINKQALDNRLTDPEQSAVDAARAMAMARKIGYNNGIAEAYRVAGIANYYRDNAEKSFENYLSAVVYFTKAGNLSGEAAVYNNMGNLFRDHDASRALEYFFQSLAIATKIKDIGLIAKLKINLGNVYNRKNSLHQALKYYEESKASFVTLKDSINIIQCLQNLGVIQYKLNNYDTALSLLLEANSAAKRYDLSETIASVDLTLASLYINQKRFDEAEKIVKEGVIYTALVKDPKMDYDYKHTTYELEYNRKDYAKALFYLREIYKVDSTTYKTNTSVQMKLIEATRKQEEQRKESERAAERQAYDRTKFWAVTIVAGLLLVVIGLLFGNVKRKAKTNAQLTLLNGEVSRQKDNLDRINHHLEEIIDERTKDLQIKNRKLSEHSSYLSHQIRGPIATLRGLINLEREGLVDEKECIAMMDKCVSEIDEKIIDMSDMLHNPARTTAT